MVNPIFTAMMTLMCGVTIPKPMMPKFYSSWLYWLSPYTYAIEGIITNDLHGSAVRCRKSELYSFEPPTGKTCNEYAGSWVTASGVGYINNPNATSSCQYCPYRVGDDYYAPLQWSFTHRWRNVGIMLGFIAFNVAFTTLMVRVYKVNKR
ncbi:ATP-binding cassette transporter snq2 [Linderina pennispora]|nr:ATP-binding cassette transporter snq2 [Linderina pennispora]